MRRLRDLLPRRRRDPAAFEYSGGFVGRFSSRAAAIRAHERYPHDTDAEGQFEPGFRTFVRVRDLLEQVPPRSKVLDVGCNSGGLGRRLMAEKGCTMFGVDVAPTMVERAREKGYEAVVAPAEELPYGDASFDVVVVSELLEHVHDPEPVLAEAARVLRPGGLLFGDVPTEMGRWGFETIADHDYHARVFTRASLAELLGAHFVVEEIDTAPREGEPHDHFDRPTWYVFRCRRERA